MTFVERHIKVPVSFCHLFVGSEYDIRPEEDKTRTRSRDKYYASDSGDLEISTPEHLEPAIYYSPL